MIFLAQLSLFNTVHFSDLDAFFFEGSGSLLVMRSKRLAMPTP